jgi:hypothetical protein
VRTEETAWHMGPVKSLWNMYKGNAGALKPQKGMRLTRNPGLEGFLHWRKSKVRQNEV